MEYMSGTLTIGSEFKYNSSTDLDVPAVIAGSAQLTKAGDGTLTLSGANSYSGGTTVSSGTLKLAGSGALGSGAVSVGEGAELEIFFANPANDLPLTFRHFDIKQAAHSTVRFANILQDAGIGRISARIELNGEVL